MVSGLTGSSCEDLKDSQHLDSSRKISYGFQLRYSICISRSSQELQLHILLPFLNLRFLETNTKIILIVQNVRRIIQCGIKILTYSKHLTIFDS